MRPASIVLVMLIAVAGPHLAFAQAKEARTAINDWESETGAYVTKAVRTKFPQYQAERFSKKAKALDFQKSDQLAAALRSSKVAILPIQLGLNAPPPGVYIADNDDHVSRVETTAPQYDYFSTLFSTGVVANFLEKFATVRLDVVPVPPRDYNVVINGEDCPPTDKGVYRVLPGSTTVSVTRPTKPPCNWNGDIRPGKEHLVSCQL